MTALLQQGHDVLRTGPLGSGLAPDSTAATRRSEEAHERPRSPPQPVPRPRAGSAAVAAQQPAAASPVQWEDALGVAASPASSDVTEQFLDCYSERECACPCAWGWVGGWPRCRRARADPCAAVPILAAALTG